MKISSYNVTDVSYHYIGLRALASLPAPARREEQMDAISKGVLKFVLDKALRLMLPEPKGTFSAIGEKVCNELVHFGFATSGKGRYELNGAGQEVLALLNAKKFGELRRAMTIAHLRTYDNLRELVRHHVEAGPIWRPVVEAGRFGAGEPDYIEKLLRPTFGDDAPAMEEEIEWQGKTPSKVEDVLRDRVLRRALAEAPMGEALFRGLSDRLISLRLLNSTRAKSEGCEFDKTYSPCATAGSRQPWHAPLQVPLMAGGSYEIFVCEPDFGDKETRRAFFKTLDSAFANLPEQAGYYDLPDVRDYVCEGMSLPEAAFDEGVNHLLDISPASLVVGLRYEGITGRRKPLSRTRGTTQIYNLIRRA